MKPLVLWASLTRTTFPVFLTELMMISLSSGTKVRGSTTSTEMPSSANSSAACMTRRSILPYVTTVTSVPSRLISPTPRGIV